jgi:DNA-binding LacI/PurR family transcriptional regulator
VVNGSPAVAGVLRARVQQAVADLGYVPNQAARTLVTRHTRLMALVIPETAHRVFSDDRFFPGIVRGVNRELGAAERQLVVAVADGEPSRERIERYALARRVDAVMFASMHGADPLPDLLARAGVPVVCNGRPLGRSRVPYVDIDHQAGVAKAVAHLVNSGRRRIATIAGPQDMVAGIDRLAGYRTSLAGTGLRSLVAIGDFTRDSGHAAMRQLLADDPDLDAVFVASDLMAHGALAALRAAGRKVPGDVAVVGFDDVDLARYTDPPLTTVRQPIERIGQELARQALRLVAGERIAARVILPTELVLRESA